MTDADGHSQPPRVVLRLHEVPLLPAPLTDLLRVANNPSATARDLRDAIEQVPTLAARVLRALFVRQPPRTPTLEEALRDLGTRGVRGVVSALVLAPLFDPDAAHSVDPTRVAEHGVACAMWTLELGSVIGRQPSPYLITAGLMHDAGVLLLDRAEPDRYARTLERARRDGLHHGDAEREDLGMTHARAGALLCARWMLPPRITELVAGHHTDAPTDPELSMLVVADHLAARHGAPTFAWCVPRPVPLEACAALGLDAAALDDLAVFAPKVQLQTRAIRVAAQVDDALDTP